MKDCLMKYKDKFIDLFWISPILVVVGIIPLLVRLRIVTLTPVERILYNVNREVSYDFFNKIKSEWLLYCAMAALLLFLIRILRKDIDLHFRWFLIPTGIYAVLVVASTYMAKYRVPFIENYTGIFNNPEEIANASNLALTGFIEQYENMYVLLCYVIIFIVTYYMVETDFQKKSIILTLIGSASVMSIIALLQYYGVSNYESDHWKRMMLGAEYENLKDYINYTLTSHFSVGTLYNPNYLGGYMAMVLMVAVSLFNGVSGKIKGIVAYGALLLVFAGLMTSNSSTGILAAAVALVAYFVLLVAKKCLPVRKTVALILGLVAVTALLNLTSDKVIDAEISSLGKEVHMIAGDYEGVFEKLILLERVDMGLRIVSTLGEMTLVSEEGRLALYDSQGAPISYDLDKDKVLIDNPAYEGYRINYSPETGTVRWRVGHGVLNLHVVPNGIAVIGSGVLSYPVDRVVPSIGFENSQEFATYRGFIWSRTFPVMMDNLLIGDGPDTFAAVFPQYDVIGKTNYALTSADLMSKPHNLYLQIGSQTGILSLLMLVVLVVGCLVSIVRNSKNNQFLPFGLFAAMVAFAVAGVANDSIVPVTALMWGLLALGFAQPKAYDSNLL